MSIKNRRLFLGVESVIYASFLLLDLIGGQVALSNSLKYIGILFCALISLFSTSQSIHGVLTFLALIFTAFADFFLLVLDQWYLAGIFAFLIVQTLYLTRIRLAGGWKIPVCIAVRIVVPFMMLQIAAALELITPLTVFVIAYFSQLICNTLESLSLHTPWSPQFSLGLLLFVGCDLCVGLHNLTIVTGIILSPELNRFAQIGMWFFYLPSQILLALSGFAEESHL